MTLEEIKSEIESFIFYAEVEARAAKKNEWGHGFQVGKINAYENCLRWLDQLEPSWHEYPKEKPKEMGYYLTTTPNGKVHEDWYNETRFEERDEEPIAWMEMPKPYKKEATNDT